MAEAKRLRLRAHIFKTPGSERKSAGSPTIVIVLVDRAAGVWTMEYERGTG